MNFRSQSRGLCSLPVLHGRISKYFCFFFFFFL
jgi:hypothetical protein